MGPYAGSPAAQEPRLPPGQQLVRDFPVLHYGSVPRLNTTAWRFRIFGLVEEPLELTYAQFMALPQVQVTGDIHCVTGWSRFDNRWEGVRFSEVWRLARPRAGAGFVMVHGANNFTTNLALDDLLRDDVLFAHRHDDHDLSREHGGPLRLVVPHLYFWKSAKWVTGLEATDQDRPGFWESFGYHMRGDPWLEERYS